MDGSLSYNMAQQEARAQHSYDSYVDMHPSKEIQNESRGSPPPLAAF